jgi:hypothetical protein
MARLCLRQQSARGRMGAKHRTGSPWLPITQQQFCVRHTLMLELVIDATRRRWSELLTDEMACWGHLHQPVLAADIKHHWPASERTRTVPWSTDQRRKCDRKRGRCDGGGRPRDQTRCCLRSGEVKRRSFGSSRGRVSKGMSNSTCACGSCRR